MKTIILFFICLIATLEAKTLYCHLKEFCKIGCFEKKRNACSCYQTFVDDRKFELVHTCHTPPYYPACDFSDKGDLQFCYCVY